MTTEIYLAKFIPDARRQEPKNVGVIVRTDDGAAARFIGEQPNGVIDGRSTRHSVGAPLDTYREWVRYWRRLVVDGGDSPEELPSVEASSFYLQKAGEVWLAEETDSVHDLVAQYFTQLVQATEPAAEELRATADRLIEQSGLTHEAGFRRDVPVPSTGLNRVETYRFPYARLNGGLTVGSHVPTHQEAFIHDALWRYLNISQDIRKVSLVQGIGEIGHIPAMELLRDTSTVIDMSAEGAATRVREAFLGHA